MKKTKRFVVTSALVASLTMGTVTTIATEQATQASVISDITDKISSIFSGSNLTPTTNGANINDYANGKKILILPAGTTPSIDSVTQALGAVPTLYGMVPATVSSIDEDKKQITFSADLSQLGTIGSAISAIAPKVNVTYAYAATVTFKDGTTSINVKKGDSSFDVNGNIYKVTGDDNTSVEVTDKGGYNYAYPGSYTINVKAVDSTNSDLSSADTPLTVNVLDAQFSNLNQTVIKGSNFDPNSVTATDTNGNALEVSTNSTVNTSKVGSYNVTYTGTARELDYKGDPMTWTAKGTVNVVDADSSQTINFQDANSGETVDSTTITGANGQNKTVEAPDGYDFVNASDANITLQKGSHTSTVKVIKSGTSVETPFSGKVSTYANSGVVPLYDGNGKQTSRSLSANSDWATDTTKTINGEKYYRVSTDEWVKGSQVYEYTSTGTTITTNSGAVKSLYSISGKKSSRALAPNSGWYTDRTATINGTQMSRVSTDEWVATSDVH